MTTVIVPRPQSSHMRSEALGSARRTARDQTVVYFNKAKNHHASNRYLQALENYVKATICDPNYFQAYCNMGTCYRCLSKYSQAKNCYLRALKLNSSDAITHYNIANLFRVIGDYQNSINHYEFVINSKEKDGKDVGVLYRDSLINIGICYKNLGLLQEAIAIYEKVNRLAGDEESGLYNHAMCLIALIESSPSKSFAIVNNERAKIINVLLDKVQILNPENRMVKVAKIKLDVLLVKTRERAHEAIKELTILLEDQSYSSVVNEIKQIIAFCEGINSFIKKSLKTQHLDNEPRSPSSNIIKNILEGFASSPLPQLPSKLAITEREAIRLIENHNYKEVQDRLRMVADKELLKNSIQLLIYLNKSEINPKYLEKAFLLYDRYFQKGLKAGKLLFQDISLETHKAIGHILNAKKFFQESAEHFQFVSQNIKNRNDVIASDHSILGQGFEEAGSMEKALEEYRAAFELQPSNEIMCYNLGCCLLECGNYDESVKYFNIFLEIIEKNIDLPAEEREEYKTECFILIALASQGQQNELQNYKKAFAKLLKLREEKGETQLEQQHMLSFFINFSYLAETSLVTLKPSSKEYKETRELLITLYQNLLNFTQCPDKEEILLNAGNFSYESKLFLKSVSFFQSITNSLLIPYRKIALCYLHLFEPAETFKYLEEDDKINSNSIVSMFTYEVIDWIYSNEGNGQFGSRLPKVREDLFYERNIYGISLIEKLQVKLKDEMVEKREIVLGYIQQILKNPSQTKLLQPYENLRFQMIKLLLKKHQKNQTESINCEIPTDILKICFNKSEKIISDLQTLNTFFLKMRSYGDEAQIMQALIYLFCYYNHAQRETIQAILKRKVSKEQSILSISLDKIIESDESECSIMSDFTSAKRLVTLVREWQQVLSQKIQKLFVAIQTLYYKNEVIQALNIENNFPRHTHFQQCNETFEKFVRLMQKIMPGQSKIVYKGENILEMKKDLVNSYESCFNQFIKRNKVPPLSLSESFTPATIYCSHQSKEDAEKFISSIFEFSSGERFKSVRCEEYVLVINKLLTLKCRWGDPLAQKSILSQVLEHITSTPIDVVHQAVLTLPKLLGVVRGCSREGEHFIKLDSTLKC